MIEVLFSQSAAGSMKAAMQSGMFEGSPRDVLCLSLALDIGDIRSESFWDGRLEVLTALFGVYPDGPETAREITDSAREAFEAFSSRIAGGEPARVWTSNSPDDACGYVWFSGVLNSSGDSGSLSSVCLPPFEEREDGTIVLRSGLGEVEASDWSRLAALERPVPALLAAAMQFRWERLEAENAPLRALVNGRLLSVPEDFYDHVVLSELAVQPEVFSEAVAIGRILGDCQLGVSDAWLAARLRAMTERGWLEPVTDAPANAPVYHRQLRKLPALPRQGERRRA